MRTVPIAAAVVLWVDFVARTVVTPVGVIAQGSGVTPLYARKHLMCAFVGVLPPIGCVEQHVLQRAHKLEHAMIFRQHSQLVVWRVYHIQRTHQGVAFARLQVQIHHSSFYFTVSQ